MAWRDQLQQGSFRGVPFYWQRSDAEVGRRIAWHEYPLRDDAYPEDLGLAPREFTLDVIVIGANYMADRDRLITALETPGSGTLVHPTYGAMRVSLNGRPRISESTSEGGMARFSLPFRIAGDNKYPAASTAAGTIVADQAVAARSAVQAGFARRFTVAVRPAYVASAAVELANDLLNLSRSLAAVVPAGLGSASLFADIQALGTGLAALVRVPVDLAAQSMSLIASLGTLSSDPLSIIGLYRGMFDFGSGLQPVPLTTGNRRQQADNQAAFVELVTTTAVIEACAASADVEFTSNQDAQQLRDELVERLDLLMETAEDDIYNALLDLRHAVIADIHTRGTDLARIVSYTPVATLPALVVAYQIYGDATQCDNLVARNHIRHPGFVAGGAPLEVLING